MPKKIRVLSIDGGGIFGVVSAMILAELERLTEKPIASLFDLIAGTSTGGIIALGLTVPDEAKRPQYSAAEMVDLYETKGQQIFSRSLLHKIVALDNLLDQKYESHGVDTVLRQKFGDKKLSETLTDVLVTAYNIEQRNAFLFKSRKARDQDDYNFLIRDIARSTSAAPTYFEPAKIMNVSKTQEQVLIDGGVFANNPSMCAYAEIKSQYPDVEDIIFVSVGTSGARESYLYEEAKGWGAAQWIVPILDVMGSGVQDTVDYQMRQLFPTDPQKTGFYIRMQASTLGEIAFDEPTESNIRLLKEFAGKYIDDHQPLLESLAGQLLLLS